MGTFSSMLMLVRDVHRGGGGSKGAGNSYSVWSASLFQEVIKK